MPDVPNFISMTAFRRGRTGSRLGLALLLCAGVAAICGSRGSPASKPCRRRPALASVTPPSRPMASQSGATTTLILRAVATSPEL